MRKAPTKPAAPRAPGRDVPLPFVSRFQVAEVLGAHPTTVAKWEREGLPVAARGAGGRASRYALPAAVQWFLARERTQYQTATGVLDLDAERARLAGAQRERVELQNAVRRGELLEVPAVVAAWSEILTTIRATLLALPAGLAAGLEATARDGGARAVEVVLRERISGALAELAAWRPPDSGAGP
jgi:phage terminase Nu1 subunit (DNA packaging protein)